MCEPFDWNKEKPVIRFKCKGRGNIPNGVETVAKNETVLIAEYKCNPFYKLKGKLFIV